LDGSKTFQFRDFFEGQRATDVPEQHPRDARDIAIHGIRGYPVEKSVVECHEGQGSQPHLIIRAVVQRGGIFQEILDSIHVI